MKATCHQDTIPALRPLPVRRGQTGFPLDLGLPCTVCGEARPLALVAYDAACQHIAICDLCVLRPETLRDVASIVARHHA